MKVGNLNSLKSLSIKAGCVFKMTLYPDDGVVPKKESDNSRTKYFVVLGKDENSILVGSVLINSAINATLINIIAEYQHCIYPSDYEFLMGKYRYVDCYKIKELNFDKIIDEVEFIGSINETDFSKIIKLVNKSPVNKPLTLKKFGIFLGIENK